MVGFTFYNINMKSISVLALVMLAATISMVAHGAGRLPAFTRGLYLLLADRDA